MSVLKKQPREEGFTAREKLDQLGEREKNARMAHRQVQTEAQAAQSGAASAEAALVEVLARRGAGQVDDAEVDRAREAAAKARELADDGWGQRLQVADRTVELIAAERTRVIAENFGELDGELEKAQADEVKAIEAELRSASERTGKLDALNSERAALLRALGRDTRDLPTFSQFESFRQMVRKRKQQEAGVA